jgi:hypothetical protein
VAIIIPFVALVVGSGGVTLAYLGWRASIYERNWQDARQRSLDWVAECVQILENLRADPAATLQTSRETPIRYGLRIYAYRQLANDLNFVAGKSGPGSWGELYVNESVLHNAATILKLVTDVWCRAHEISTSTSALDESSAPANNAYLIGRLDRGMQRLGMLDEQIRSYQLRPWIVNAVRRRKYPSYKTWITETPLEFPLLNWIHS